MPFIRPARRLIQGQGGSTLVELLVAMPVAIVVLGIAFGALASSSFSQQDVERRTEALTQGQIGLERMTRELRQAEWVLFRNSSVVDLEAPVRPSPAHTAVPRLVRYDCSRTECLRLEGPPVAFPPPADPVFSASRVLVGADVSESRSRYGRVAAHDVFRPKRVDPTTGATVTDFVEPSLVDIRLVLAIAGRDEPLVLSDGVSLRNRGAFR